MRQVCGVHVAQVVLASRAQKVRLGHDRHTEPGQGGAEAVGDDSGMLDPVACQRSDLLERDHGEHQRLPSDAVHGDRSSGPVAAGDLRGQVVEDGQVVVAQQQLARACAEAGRQGGAGGRAEQREPLRHRAGPHRFGQEVDGRRVEVGGGVGEPGDPVGREPPRGCGQVRRRVGQRRPQPVVVSPQPPGGLPIGIALHVGGVVEHLPDLGERGGVERPQGAAVVLHPDRYVTPHPVQHMPVQRARDRLVIAHATHPPGPGGGLAESLLQPGAVAHAGGGAVHRLGGLGQGEQVDVVVVQARQQRTAGTADHVGSARMVSLWRSYVADSAVGHVDVAAPAVNVHIGDHEARHSPAGRGLGGATGTAPPAYSTHQSPPRRTT